MIEQLCEYAEIHWNYMGELHDMSIMAYWRINKNLLGVNEWQTETGTWCVLRKWGLATVLLPHP